MGSGSRRLERFLLGVRKLPEAAPATAFRASYQQEPVAAPQGDGDLLNTHGRTPRNADGNGVFDPLAMRHAAACQGAAPALRCLWRADERPQLHQPLVEGPCP